MAIDGHELDDLEHRMDRQLPICCRDVRFEEEEVNSVVCGLMLEDGSSKHVNTIEVDPSNVLMCNHGVWAEFPAGVINHKAQHV